jgi:predicted acylesterase/phospholipase RssA
MSALRLVPVLTGGGARSPAHVGVLAALADLRVDYDRLVGISGGSIVVALHVVSVRASYLLRRGNIGSQLSGA